MRFLKNIFTEEYDPTRNFLAYVKVKVLVEDSYKHKIVDDSGKDVTLELLDTGGYEVLSSPLYTKVCTKFNGCAY